MEERGKGMGLQLVMMVPAAPLPEYHLGITVRNMDHHFYYFGNKLHRVTSWINGERNGPMIQFEDDGSRMETTYVNDECGEVIHYNVNGSIRRTCINWEWVGYEGPGKN